MRASAITREVGLSRVVLLPRSSGIPGELFPRVGFIVINKVRSAKNVLRRIVRTKVRAVPDDRAVFHDAVLEEYRLPTADLGAGEEHAPRRVDDLFRDRLLHVRLAREESEDRETDDDDEDRRLPPA